MEKLKPVLAQHFWIVGGVALVAPLVGWWMMTGDAEKVYADRSQTLDQTYQQLTTTPRENERWSNGLKSINDEDQKELEKAEDRVYKIQKKLKYWPTTVRDVMEECPEFAPPQEISERVATVPILYAEAYLPQIRDLRRIVNPMVLDSRDPLYPGDPRKGTIELPQSVIPHFPESKWNGAGAAPPTFKEIWSEQEDIWLMRSLLEAIARVNKGSERITESPIRRVEEIALFGGVRKTDADLATPAGGGDEGEPGDAEAGATYTTDFTDGDGDNEKSVSVDINLGEEFSDVALKSGKAGGSGDSQMNGQDTDDGGSPSLLAADSGGGAANAGMDDGDEGGDGGQEPKEPPRYVDDNEEEPYRTRGFKLKVLMDHRHISDFLVALSDSNWPVEIIRVQYAQAVPDPHIVGNQRGLDTGDEPGMNTPTYRPPTQTFPSAGRALTGGPAVNFGDSGGGAAAADAGPFAGSGSDRSTADPEYQKYLKNVAIARRRQALAFTDPMMTEVVVVGLLTIYKTPEAEQPAADAAADNTATPQAVPAADDSSPETPTPEAGEPAATETNDPTGTPSDTPSAPLDPAATTKENGTTSPPTEETAP